MMITLILIAIGFTLISLICTVVWLLKVSGMFESVKIRIAQPPFESMTIVYKLQRGAYSNSAEIFKDILNYSPSHQTLGIYYDNPEIVPAESCRYVVGAIVDESKDQELIERMKAENYNIFQVPKPVQSVYTTFPFSSVFSVSIAAMKVPKRLSTFIQANKLNAHPFVEVYETTLIHYYAPLSEHEAYDVPELSAE